MEKIRRILRENSIPITILIFTIILLIVIIMNYISSIKNIIKKDIPVSKVDFTQEGNMNLDGEEIDIQNIVNENLINETDGKSNDIDNYNKENKNKLPYYIKVNYKAQVVNIFRKDNQGSYTIPLKAMVCSTGSATPISGVYAMPRKYRWIKLIGDVWGQYSTQITGNILFHSVPYLQKDPSTLITNYYDKLGTYASAGCIRLTTADALWIYNNCPIGTKVEFYSSSNPGPLGKPVARKLSQEKSPYRNWDPTDPAKENPWRNYVPNRPEENNNIINDVVNEISNNILTNDTTNNIVNEIENDIIINEIINDFV